MGGRECQCRPQRSNRVKADSIFTCTACGKELVKWMGRCPACGEWNTIVQKQVSAVRSTAVSRSAGEAAEWGEVRPITDVPSEREPRLLTGIDEFDRVLGGGMVRRSVVLLAGDPGIGKSTLLTQALGAMAARGDRVLYVSGEESLDQIRLRADRLGVRADDFLVLMENELEVILDRLGDSSGCVVAVDSIQSLFSRSLEAAPATVSQVRFTAGRIIDAIKRSDAACVVVGHVTKGGDIAGPKLLEHMVDTVLYFEGERGYPYRILRAVKNRFGSASEIGVFEMGDAGLAPVGNPSAHFLAERPEGVSGSVVTGLVEGSRPILAEVQALVTGPVPGQGRRTCLGIDPQRLALMVAVLEKKLGLGLADQDIFLNAVGGIRATEPSADLAIAAALLSSFTDRPVPMRTVVFGEVGLAGEVRRVSRAAARLTEAQRLGFTRIIAPRSNIEAWNGDPAVTCIGMSHVKELSRVLFEPRGGKGK